MSLQTKKYITPEEYLAAEREAFYKNEYYDGIISAFPCLDSQHNIITANLIGIIGFQLKRSACQIYPSNMRLHVLANGFFTYPDISIVCGEKQFLNEEHDTLLNPTLIIEVLSPSTADYDRGKKFMLYRSILSLQHYILVDAQTCHIEKYSKNETGNWVLSETKDINAILNLENLDVNLAVADIYEDTEDI